MEKLESFKDVCGSKVKDDILNLKWFMVNFKNDSENGTAYYYGKDELDVVKSHGFTVGTLEDIDHKLIEVDNIPIKSKMIYIITKDGKRHTVLYTGINSFFTHCEKMFREGKPFPTIMDYTFTDSKISFKVEVTNYTVDLYEM